MGLGEIMDKFIPYVLAIAATLGCDDSVNQPHRVVYNTLPITVELTSVMASRFYIHDLDGDGSADVIAHTHFFFCAAPEKELAKNHTLKLDYLCMFYDY